MIGARARRVLVGLLVGAAGCHGAPSPEPVPDEPTWARDVLPILRGNCFGCHGSGEPCEIDAKVVKPHGCRSGRTFWYIRDPADFPPELKEVADGVGSARAAIMTILGPLRGPAGAAMTRMPPPPAEPLSDRDIEVLETWMAAQFPKGQHTPNRRPWVRLVGKRLVEGALIATVDVTDGNDDQVLGELRAGEVKAPIRASGRQELRLEGATMTAPLSYVASDGWATVSGDLR